MTSTVSVYVGSSPRGRGARGTREWPSATRGLIPARAGSTCVAGRYFRAKGAHPRAGGEHSP